MPYKMPYYIYSKHTAGTGDGVPAPGGGLSTLQFLQYATFSKVEIINPGFALLYFDVDRDFYAVRNVINVSIVGLPFDMNGEWRIYKKIDARRYIIRVFPEFPVGVWDVQGEILTDVPFPIPWDMSDNYPSFYYEPLKTTISFGYFYYSRQMVYVPEKFFYHPDSGWFYNPTDPDIKRYHGNGNYIHDGKPIFLWWRPENSNLIFEMDGETYMCVAESGHSALVPWLPEKVQE